MRRREAQSVRARPAARQSRKRCGVTSNVSEGTSRTQYIRRADSNREARTLQEEKDWMTAEWQCVDGRDRVNTGMWWYVMVSGEGETEEFWGGDVTRNRLAQMLLS